MRPRVCNQAVIKTAAWAAEREFNFKYAELSNAKLFITLPDDLAGVSLLDRNRHLPGIPLDLSATLPGM